MSTVQFEHEVTQRTGGAQILHLSGELITDDASALRRLLHEQASEGGIVDLSGVKRLDGSAAATLVEAVRVAQSHGAELALAGTDAGMQRVLSLYERPPRDSVRGAPVREGILHHIGRAAMEGRDLTRDVADYMGHLAASFGAAIKRPSSVRWSDVTRLMERHGPDAIPIVTLIGFLIGLITAFQAAIQLRKFGADTFVADLVGLSVTRELAPLMTAIVVAGRSGAAIAAEIGTMRVSEELDALRTLGLDPMRFLVLPRMVAVAFVTPLLTLLADLVGVVGGLVIALTTLDVSWQGYIISTREAVGVNDVATGLAKAFAFGCMVALIAAERGMRARGGAEGVGRYTTQAVVAILFHLVLFDAIFTSLTNLWGV